MVLFNRPFAASSLMAEQMIRVILEGKHMCNPTGVGVEKLKFSFDGIDMGVIKWSRMGSARGHYMRSKGNNCLVQ